MNNVLMIKGNMVHYVPNELVEEFKNHGWTEADLTEKAEETTEKETTTKKRTKKSN